MSEAALAPAAPHRSLTWDDLQALVVDSVTSPHSNVLTRGRSRILRDGQNRQGRELRSARRSSSATAPSSRRKDSRRPPSMSGLWL